MQDKETAISVFHYLWSSFYIVISEKKHIYNRSFITSIYFSVLHVYKC